MRHRQMIAPDTSDKEREELSRELKKYCKLDTLAMVKIYEFLNNV